jgi:Concanavalin A-like lectin/glucanases superfamily
MRLWGLVACLLVALTAGGCRRSGPTTVTITLRIEDEAFRPDYVLMTWAQPSGRELRDIRVPEHGSFAAQGPVLGSVSIELESEMAGERRLRITGLRHELRVAGATAVIPWASGREQQVTLTLGCADDLELFEVVSLCREPEPARPPPEAGRDAGSDGPAKPSNPAPVVVMNNDARPPADAATEAPPIEESVPTPTSDALASAPPDVKPEADGGTPPDRPPPPPGNTDLGRGLLVYLRLDDAASSLNARDSSGNKHQATLVGLDVKSAWIKGKTGAALAFPTTPGWVRVDSTPVLNQIREGFTISAFVRTNGNGNPGRRTIAARRAIGPGGFLYSLHLVGNRPGFFIHSNNGANANATSDLALPENRWVHLALVYDRQSARILVDGRLAVQQNYQLTIGPENAPLSIGASEEPNPALGTDPLGAELDEIAVWDRALTPAEVSALAAGVEPPAR